MKKDSVRKLERENLAAVEGQIWNTSQEVVAKDLTVFMIRVTAGHQAEVSRFRHLGNLR